MNKRERVTAALRHEPTDFTPWHVFLTKEAEEAVEGFTGKPGFADGMQNHIAMVYHGSEEWIRPGYARDQFGVVWNRTVDKDIGVIEDPIIKTAEPGSHTLPKPDTHAIPGMYGAMIATADDRFRMGMIGFSMFERAWTLRGMENFLMDMVENPAFVDWLLDAILEYNLAILDRALTEDIDCFYFGDDWGQQKGLIMGPRMWRRFIKPRMEEMFRRVKDAGKFVCLHSCGDIQELFPELIDMGLDLFNTFQPEVMDIHRIKAEYGKDLGFWGGLSTQRFLPYATPGEVRERTLRLCAEMGEGGGYVCGPTHSIPRDTPPENIIALLDALHEQAGMA